MKQIYKYTLLFSLLLCGANLACSQSYNNGTWYSLYNTKEYNNQDVTLDVFSPNTGNLSLQWKKTGTFFGYPIFTLKVSESSNGGTNYTNEQTIINSGATTKSDSYKTIYATVGKEINKLKFDQSGSLQRYYKNIQLPMAKHIRLDNESTYGVANISKSFGNVEWGSTSAAQTVNFRSFLTNGNITVKLTSGDENVWRLGSADNTSGQITSSKDGYTYAIGANQFAYNGSGACSTGKAGKASGYDFVVYFHPTDVGNYTGTITITDGKSTATVSLSGTGIKQTPYISDCVTLSASSVKYNDALADVTAAGTAKGRQGQVVAGTWTSSPAKINGCTSNYTFTFVPTDQTRYNTKNNGNAITCVFTLDMTKFVKTAQTISWSQSGLQIGDLQLNATTSGHDASVYYTSSDESIATIDGNWLRMVKPGYVTITAHAAATCNYSAADVSRDFELSRTRPVVTPNVVNLTYGEPLSLATPTCTATYSGETVSGTFEWVNPSLLPEVGTSQQQALFTPDDDTRFSALTVDVTVVVAKASPNMIWRAGSTLRANTNYNEPISTGNKETGIMVTTDNANVIYDAQNDMLIVGSFTERTLVHITATQEATTHYKRESHSYTVYIMPKSNVCVDKTYDGDNQWHVDINDEETYADAFAGNDGTISWHNSNETGSGKYLGFNVTYPLYKGIQLGDWTEGLNLNALGQMSQNGAYKQKYVILSVTGVPKDISFSTKIQDVHVKAVFDFHYWATNRNWELLESADMSTWTSLKTWTNEDNSSSYNVNNILLNPRTRYIKIIYKGNFTGTVQDLRITRRHGFEVGADRNYTTSTTLPAFGTEEHPLQVPQVIQFRYYSLGACGQVGDSIAVSTDNDHFYADIEGITRNVNFDQYGTYNLVVRATNVGETGTITLQSTDGAYLHINVSSETPDITASTKIFYSGTEQNQRVEGDKYRGMKLLDFSKCFNGASPLFDTLYIFGVSGNTELVRNKFDYYDPQKEYNLPKLNVVDDETACNAQTPLFVYYKNGNKYSYKRSVENVALKNMRNIEAGGKSFGVLGYVPYAYTGANGSVGGFMSFIGNSGQRADVTLIDAEIMSREHTDDGRPTDYTTNNVTLGRGDNLVGGSSAPLVFKTNSTTEPFNAMLHFVGDNRLVASNGMPLTRLNAKVQSVSINGSATLRPSAAIALLTGSNDTKVDLTIDDIWNGAHQVTSTLDLVPATGVGSIGLGNEKNTLTINGGIIKLYNGTNEHNPLAIAYRRTTLEKDGQVSMAYGIGADKSNSKVTITDGTILSDGTLKLPYYTVITGGTFNGGDINCYEEITLPAVSATDGNGHKVSRSHLLPEEIPANYNMQSVVLEDDGKLNPMLPETEERVEQVKMWVAATPDHQDAAEATVSRNLLYQEITDAQQAYEGKDAAYQPILNNNNYEVDGEMSMLMQVDSADKWRMFVAPFDITEVYVLELDDEAKWENKDRATALAEQQVVTKEFNDYLSQYVNAERPTTLSLFGIVNKFIQDNSGAKIYDLVYYNGKNARYSDYYLYQIDSDGEHESWHFNGEELESKWKIAQQEGDVIMKQGHTYAIMFPYCTNCPTFDGYDYWTGKYVVLQGKGHQTMYGMSAAVEQLNEAYSIANSDAVLAGNISFENITTTKRVFTYDAKSDYYTANDHGAVLRPTESALFANVTNSNGGRVKTIARSGHATFEDEAPQEQVEEPQITTAWENLIGDKGWVAVGASGAIVITSSTNDIVGLYTTAGQLVQTLALTQGSQQEIVLEAGVYVLRGTHNTQKVIVK